jgi:hypothetical protein
VEAIELFAYQRENWLWWNFNPKRDPGLGPLRFEELERFFLSQMSNAGKVAYWLSKGKKV